jgi:long-chain acyl-CoA synthetase
VTTMTSPVAADRVSAAPDYIWLRHYEPSVRSTLDYPTVPLHGLLEATAERTPQAIATEFYGAHLTYAEINRLADAFCAYLQSLDVKKGDRVAVVLPNSPQFIIAYYGALKAGAIVVPTNPLYVPRELEQQFNDAGVETVICLSHPVWPRVDEIRANTSIKNVIVTHINDFFPLHLRTLYPIKAKTEHTWSDYKHDPANGVHAFTHAVNHSLRRKPVAMQPDDLALLQYTGGTTGTPKGAMLTHHNLVANTVQVNEWFTTDDARNGKAIFFAVTPFFHVYGMTVVMSHALYSGAKLLLLPRWVTEDVLEAIEHGHPTIFSGVPTMYIAINNTPGIDQRDLSSIKACISGAAPLPIEVAEEFERLTGGRLVEGYGLTEAAPVTHCNPMYGQRKAGSIGVPFPDVEARIVDANSHADLPQGEIGELAIRAPQVMKGYWQRPEESANVLSPDGWLYTGDLARMDEEGYFFIVDRKKDMIIAGGYNIYPRDVEEVIYQHPAVQEAVVAGIPDRYRGETVKAYIVLKAEQQASADEIIAFCRARLAAYKVPHLIEFRDNLPKTLIGKFLRRQLVEEDTHKLHAAQHPTVETPPIEDADDALVDPMPAE